MSLLEAISDGERGLLPPMTIGVVISLDDPDKLGRVEVKLPDWGEEGSSLGFLRVLTPMSGAEWGMFCLPEVGDEILIGFCDGGIHGACVLGSFWNGKHKQPVQIEDGKHDVRIFKSRAGHSVTFFDKDGEERLEIGSAKGLHILLDDKEERIALSDKDKKILLSLDVKNGEITIQAEKKIIFQAGKSSAAIGDSVTLESGGTLEFKGQDVKLDAKSSVAVAGKSSVEVKASGQLNLEAGGPAALKGATLKLN